MKKNLLPYSWFVNPEGHVVPVGNLYTIFLNGLTPSMETFFDNPEEGLNGFVPKSLSSVTFLRDLKRFYFLVRPDVPGLALIGVIGTDGNIKVLFCGTKKPVKLLETKDEVVFFMLTPNGKKPEDMQLDGECLLSFKLLQEQGKSLEDLKNSLETESLHGKMLLFGDFVRNLPPFFEPKAWNLSRKRRHEEMVEKAKKSAIEEKLKEIKHGLEKIFKGHTGVKEALLHLAEKFMACEDANKRSFSSSAKRRLGKGVLAQCDQISSTRGNKRITSEILNVFADHLEISPFEKEVRDFEDDVLHLSIEVREELFLLYSQYLDSLRKGVDSAKHRKKIGEGVTALAHNAEVSDGVKRVLEQRFMTTIPDPPAIANRDEDEFL